MIQTLKHLYAIMTLAALSTALLKGDEHFPLRNGDFSVSQEVGLPADWVRYTESGEYLFKSDPSTDQMTHAPAIAQITAVKPGKACYYQEVDLLKGEYSLSLEVQAEGGSTAAIAVANQSVNKTGATGWQKVTLDFSAQGKTRVHLYGVGAGEVGFKNVRIEIKKLHSTFLATQGGLPLGAIVLAENPTETERYAAYELQRCLFLITGKTIGLKGRDSVSPGREIWLGTICGSAYLKKIASSDAEAYRILIDEKKIHLAGRSPRATLYAAYDFLKMHGCGWYLPGAIGEVVPKADALKLLATDRCEAPDYAVRGFLIYAQNFVLTGQWKYLNANDYQDWLVRNRANAWWHGASHTLPIGPHRGGEHSQTLNHSWGQFLVDDHPEWWPQVKGKRVKNHTSGRPNQLCLSNSKLRQRVTETIIKHFKDHPEDVGFALNAEDEPCFWCECDACRALDPDQGKGPWKADAAGLPEMAMSDRTLNFASEIAENVSKVCPDRFVELYAYASIQVPPVREKVSPHLLIKFTHWPTAPLNKSILDESIEYNKKVISRMDGWKKAGTKEFGLYDYGNWVETESPNLRLSHAADVLKTFHDKWGVRHCLPENDNNFWGSMMIYNLRAALLWNTKLDYQKQIQKICTDFYGPAGELFVEYYRFMDEVLMKSEAWKKKDWEATLLAEYDIESMIKASEILERAAKRVQGNKVLEERVAIARYAQANLTFRIAQIKPEVLSSAATESANQAHQLAVQLVQDYKIPIYRFGLSPLQTMYLPPAIKAPIRTLPSEWRFKIDPKNVGINEKWYAKAPDNWESISIERDWRSQGHDYHGVAWYFTPLELSEAELKQLKESGKSAALYFGAVDGNADVYLDGEKIGEQKQGVEFMWDKAFAILLPSSVGKTAKHFLLVRVEKQMDKVGAGIWKPISIVSLRDVAIKEVALSKEEIHSESNAINDAEGMETNGKTGWAVWGPQYLKSFTSTDAAEPLKGKYHFVVEGHNGTTIYHPFNTEIGKSYKITYHVRVESGGVMACVFTDTKEDPYNSILIQKDYYKKSYQEFEIYFTAQTEISNFGFRLTSREEVISTAYMDDLSIRECAP